MGDIFEALQRAGHGDDPSPGSNPRDDRAQNRAQDDHRPQTGSTFDATLLPDLNASDDEPIQPWSNTATSATSAMPAPGSTPQPKAAPPSRHEDMNDAHHAHYAHDPQTERSSHNAGRESFEPNTSHSRDSHVGRLTQVDPTRVDDRLVVLTQPTKGAAEQYRSIRTGMLARWRHQRHLIHTITSATPQEGKTITSLNLGMSFAELRNRRTVVIEADLRIPQFANLLTLDDGPGLVDVLEGKASFKEAVQTLSTGGLDVIAAGRRANDQAIQLLSSASAASLLKMLRRESDHVIIDTPPVVELADAGILGALSDDVLLIVRMNRTPRTLIDQSIRTLNSYNAPVAGLIATDHPRHRERYYNYRYGYRYRYGEYAKAA